MEAQRHHLRRAADELPRRGRHPGAVRRHPGRADGELTLDEVVKARRRRRPAWWPATPLLGADGQRWTTWDQASAYFRAHPGKTISSDVRAQTAAGAAAEKTISVTLIENPQAPGSGYLGRGRRRGARPPRAAARRHAGPDRLQGRRGRHVHRLLVADPGKINPTGPEGAVGPVGIINVSHQAVQQSWYPMLLAFLSFNLGLMNLLPILPFDGGHIALNVVERVRGRRLNAKGARAHGGLRHGTARDAVHLPHVQRREEAVRRLGGPAAARGAFRAVR